MYLNQLTIIGFTGQDAEFHFTSNGTPITTVSIATKESWKEIGKAEPIGIGLSPSESSLNTPKLSPRGLMSWFRAPSDRASTRKTAYPTVFTNSAPDAIAKLDRAERRDERETEPLDS